MPLSWRHGDIFGAAHTFLEWPLAKRHIHVKTSSRSFYLGLIVGHETLLEIVILLADPANGFSPTDFW